jgi:transcriptional regulator with XRE-family HTH domain
MRGMTATDVSDMPLREARLRVELSIREVERRTGINRGRLSIIERGVEPTEDEHRRIREAIRQGPPA